MPSLQQTVDSARLAIEEERAKAALAATIAANRAFLKYVSRDPKPTVHEISRWVQANLVLLMWRAEEYTR